MIETKNVPEQEQLYSQTVVAIVQCLHLLGLFCAYFDFRPVPMRNIGVVGGLWWVHCVCTLCVCVCLSYLLVHRWCVEMRPLMAF